MAVAAVAAARSSRDGLSHGIGVSVRFVAPGRVPSFFLFELVV